MTLGANSPNADSSYSEVGAFHSGVRFDYAGAVAGKYEGTVFTEARVELVLSLSDDAIKESTRHIRDAQQYPERTFPSWPGKTVPGKGEPLHRLINREEQDANRDRAIDTCHDVWGNYEGTRPQCDEYPFSSTHEGANAGNDRYSARLIDGDDNEAGGRRLNSMYTANRILDGDPFYVKVTSCPAEEASAVKLITEYSTHARPDRRIVEVYDADAYLGGDEALAASRSRVAAGNGYHLYLHSLQPDIDVHVAIRVWDAPQEPPKGAEGTVPVSLESETGTLVINQFTLGPAGEMPLPRPGVYEGHAWWDGRQATADYYNQCGHRRAIEQWDSRQLRQAWRQCPVQERYVLDLWYVREPDPVDDEDL
ncbi:NucA/NucB deoxyribonuclease domain-containing protein [Streptomyces sp. enrichment culture]|uniref:NucA/NucB deoxyribonuclease domain-containing protein n=1 Tax=Streptomyces sp. enrichment culture TaxID=1795815 RepID=UPI003F556B7B